MTYREYKDKVRACWLNEWSSGTQFTDTAVTIPAAALTKGRYDLHLIVTANGFPSKLYIPLVFVHA